MTAAKIVVPAQNAVSAQRDNKPPFDLPSGIEKDACRLREEVAHPPCIAGKYRDLTTPPFVLSYKKSCGHGPEVKVFDSKDKLGQKYYSYAVAIGSAMACKLRIKQVIQLMKSLAPEVQSAVAAKTLKSLVDDYGTVDLSKDPRPDKYSVYWAHKALVDVKDGGEFAMPYDIPAMHFYQQLDKQEHDMPIGDSYQPGAHYELDYAEFDGYRITRNSDTKAYKITKLDPA